MVPINNGKYKRKSFIGDPNGFVYAQKGTLFKRQFYEYKLVYPGSVAINYTSNYYEPTQLEYENDSVESIWIKTTSISNSSGWSKIPSSPRVDVDIYYILQINGSDEYLSIDGISEFIRYD